MWYFRHTSYIERLFLNERGRWLFVDFYICFVLRLKTKTICCNIRTSYRWNHPRIFYLNAFMNVLLFIMNSRMIRTRLKFHVHVYLILRVIIRSYCFKPVVIIQKFSYKVKHIKRSFLEFVYAHIYCFFCKYIRITFSVVLAHIN
jgi:hypothetical protein